MTVYFLLLMKCLLSAHAITIPSSSLSFINNLSFVNLTSADEPSLSPSQSIVEDSRSKWYCTPTQRWNQPRMELGDCKGALEYFYYETMTDGGMKSMEFLSPGAAKATHFKLQMTPRKYIFGTCTLAIVIVQDFPMPLTLPGGYKTGPPTDSATYLNLNRVATSLVEKCIFSNGEAGWQLTGHSNGIGVFVWSTGSQEDEEIRIENEKARFMFPALKKSENGSAETSRPFAHAS